MSNDIIITGIPRSGTTLLTALIDSMQDSVALNEPEWQYEWANKNKAAYTARDFASWLAGDFAATRRKLLQGVAIPERRGKGGGAVTNYYRLDQQRQQVENTFSVMPFVRPGLMPDFTLAIKHAGLYLGALPAIIDSGAFSVIAIIRHPVGVIASWNQVHVPPGKGKLPGAIYWDKMRALTGTNMELLEKQVRMYDLMCHRLYSLRERIHLITYEALVDNPGMLAAITGKAPAVSAGMIQKRDHDFYNVETQAIKEMLKRVGNDYRLLYDAA